MGISQVFVDYLKPSNGTSKDKAGEFFWVPTPEINFKIVETQRATPSAHARVEFKLAHFDRKRHYTEKDHLPVKLIQMDARSEALLYRSKLRPCLVLGAARVSDHDTLASVSDQRQSKVLANEAYLVAPVFSANSPADPKGPFPPQMLARIKVLHYPHLAWIPDFNSQGPGSVLRLDRIFATELTNEMQHCGHKVNSDVLAIIQAQTATLLGLELAPAQSEMLKITRELVQDCLPPGL